jgi:hypothetical protein
MREDIRKLHREGQISERQMKKVADYEALDGIPSGAISSGHIGDTGSSIGIDSKPNRRMFPKESRTGAREKRPKWPSDEAVKRTGAVEYFSNRWYGDPARRQE